jgi:hypothetical protein
MKFYNCYTIMAGQDSCRLNCLDDDQDPLSQLRCRLLAHRVVSLRCNDSAAIGTRAVSPIGAFMSSRPGDRRIQGDVCPAKGQGLELARVNKFTVISRGMR